MSHTHPKIKKQNSFYLVIDDQVWWGEKGADEPDHKYRVNHRPRLPKCVLKRVADG